MAAQLENAVVVRNEALTDSVMRLRLKAPEIAQKAVPGQFVNIRVSASVAPLLRRPFGVAGVDLERGTLDVIYRVIGSGTQTLAAAREGDTVSVNGPLGRGFDLTKAKTLIVGGGLGLAPLLFLASRKAGCDVLMGGRTETELFWEALYAPYSKSITLCTDDGSRGIKGNVLAALPELLKAHAYDAVYVCGPEPMMRAVSRACEEAGVFCQVSLEKYMACGMGACLSCSCTSASGARVKVCQDGPVFVSTELHEW